MRKEAGPQSKRSIREELDKTLEGIVKETERQELMSLGLTPELELEIEQKVSLPNNVKKTKARKDRALETVKKWVQDNPRYRRKYIGQNVNIENIDQEELAIDFVDFLVSQAAKTRGFRGARFFEEEKIRKIRTFIGKRNIVVAVEDEEGSAAEFYFQQQIPFKLLRSREIDEENQTENKFNF